ncbi:MAG TPA: endoribonuclease MazF [Thermoanaerobaculia bacterium]|nr:endoribonuclease MazF [Thermoanaerobaculia bacterium]
MTYVPDQGHAIWFTFDPQTGREQAGRRPAIVLTPAAYNRKTGLVLVCPVTSQAKGYPFEVSLPIGLPVSGVILSDHVKSADWRARQAVFICALPPAVLPHVLAKLSALLASV